MIRIEPDTRRWWARMANRMAILALPALLVVGCGDDEGGAANTPVPTATATSPAAATFTATAVRTSTPTATSPPPTTTATSLPSLTPTTAPNPDAMAACAKLAACNQCFTNSTGQCVTQETCAQRLTNDSAICVNGVGGCGATSLGDCLFLGCDGTDPTGECQ